MEITVTTKVEICSIGRKINDYCNKTTYCRSLGLTKVSNLSEQDRIFLSGEAECLYQLIALCAIIMRKFSLLVMKVYRSIAVTHSMFTRYMLKVSLYMIKLYY